MHTTILLFGAYAAVAYFSAVIAGSPGECGVIGRTEWGAIPSQGGAENLTLPVNIVVIQDTVTRRCPNTDQCIDQLKALQQYHMITLGYSDIGQTFLVDDNGNIYEGRGWNTVGTHTKRYDSISIAIAFIGNYLYDNVSTKSIKAVQDLLKCGTEKGYLSTHYHLAAHRDLTASLSPGDTLYNELKAWPHYNASISYS